MARDLVKIVFISDLHYSLFPNSACPERRGEYMPSILAKTVKKINAEVKADLLLVGGDLINFPEAEEAERLTSIIAEILSLADMECTVIRGNHDIPQERFVKYFPFKEVTDIDFVRIVAFDDAETPNYNANRSLSDLKRMRKNAEFDGVKFLFQHTPLLPRERCIYSYDNAKEILQLMSELNYRGALSGHFHQGIELFEENNLQFFVQSALCESPFAASLLTISENGIECVEKIVI